MNADNPFEPDSWRPVDGFDLTDITYHRHVVDGAPQPTVRVAFDRPEVRNAFRPHTVDELYRVLDHARMSPDVGVVLLDRQRAVAEGRRLGVLFRWRPTHPRPHRLPVRRRRDRRHRRRGPRRTAAHPRGAAADPVHAQGRHLPRQRLGRRRRAQPARGVRPDAGQPRARPVQADRRRRRQLRRRLRQRVSRQAGRPEVRPRDLLPRPPVYRRADACDGRGQRGRRPRRSRDGRRSTGPRPSTASRRRPSAC